MNGMKARRTDLGLSQPDVVKLLETLGIKTDVSMLSRFENEVCLPTASTKEALDFIFSTPELADDIISDRKPTVSGTRLYNIWQGMKQRCNDENCKSYPLYGGRGITVCKEWSNGSEVFQAWALSNGYRDDLTIDRIDNDGNYCSDNCRWVTWKEQANNTRRNRFISYNGVTHTLTEWADIFGINWNTLRSRIDNGWSIERALTERTETVLQAPRTQLLEADELAALPDDEGQEKALCVNPYYAMLATAIPYGRRNAITRQALAAKLGMNDRTARKAIEEARAAGLLIMCEQNGRGYYQSDDPVEMRCQYQQDTNRAMSILKRRKPLRDALRAAGQRV